jgi:hypothetical protein
MVGLAELVLSNNEEVAAVGWLSGRSTPRSLQVSPSWRRDREIRVQGGSIDVYLSDESTAPDVDDPTLVRVVGAWRDDAIHLALVELVDPSQPFDDGGGSIPAGPPGTELTAPSPSEEATLERLLAAGDIIWHRVYSDPDGRRTVRVASDRRTAIQSDLAAAFPAGVEITDSRWSQADLVEVHRTLAEHRKDWRVTATGGGFQSKTDGVFGAAVEVLHLHPALAAWADTLPTGLLKITVLVQPLRAAAVRTGPR